MAQGKSYYEIGDSGFDGLALPYSLEAEQSVLGSILIDPASILQVLEYLKPQYFYLPQHREIFTVMVRMFSESSVIDFVTMLDELKSQGVYDEAGGKAYLMQLAQMVPSVANIEAYAKIVQEKYFLRSLITASREIISSAAEEAGDARMILDSAEQKIYDIRQDKGADGLRHIKDIIIETYDRLHAISNDEDGRFVGTPTGFSELDRLITGLNRSDLILLAARPAMGKSAFAINIAANVAKRGEKVAFFTLEMTREQNVERMLSSESLIENRALRTGELKADDWVRLAQAADELSKYQLYFDDTSGITIPEMKAKCRRIKGLGLVVIDYLQLLSSGRRIENRVQEVSEMTRNLKIMAKDLDVPIITLSQLSRGTESRQGHRPMLSDLRESGSIEQDADIVMFLYREDYYEQNEQNHNQATCIVAKNRHGAVGDVPLHWDGAHTKFTSQEKYRDEP
ncbi:MAG TPA: replicative DNA helicase [Clostridia bacterium]|nr:replicative DNA helicase [Clostridia bacterium]